MGIIAYDFLGIPEENLKVLCEECDKFGKKTLHSLGCTPLEKPGKIVMAYFEACKKAKKDEDELTCIIADTIGEVAGVEESGRLAKAIVRQVVDFEEALGEQPRTYKKLLGGRARERRNPR